MDKKLISNRPPIIWAPYFGDAPTLVGLYPTVYLKFFYPAWGFFPFSLPLGLREVKRGKNFQIVHIESTAFVDEKCVKRLFLFIQDEAKQL
jgi:hypothetical protein